MIKCIGYLRSLKQLLSILLISCFIFGLGSFVNATYQEIGLDFKPSSLNNNYSINVIPKGGFITNYLGVSKSVLGFSNSTLFFWDTDGIPYYYLSNSVQGNFKIYYLCDFFGSGGTTMLHCSSSNISDNLTPLNNFFSSIVNGDYFYYSVQTSDNFFCWSSQYYNNSICFKYNGSSSLTGSKGYSGLSFGNINSSMYLTYPFGINGGNNNSSGNIQSPDGVELDSTEGALDYYENYYGWNSDICYIGVNSMNILWGASGVSFNQGGGLTIFEAFNQLYNSTDNNKVYVWINSWLINYRNWFNRSDMNEPPLYLANYNYSGNSVDIYYDNLSFPFSNNPLGVYFMSDFIDYKGTLCDSSCGSDVVSYCNIKLNGGTFEDIIDNSSKESINKYISQKNINNGLNGDGTEKTSPFSYSSTGTDYTGAVDFINYYIGKFNGLINTDYDGPGFLPAYIIGFMLLLIFFRFISH